MAANKPFRFGPIVLTTTTTTNILNPGTTTGGVASTASPYGNLFLLLRHIRVVNTTNGAVSFCLFLGSTGTNSQGAGFLFPGTCSAGSLTTGVSVAASSYVEAFGLWRLDVADFLVGGAGSATSLNIQGEGEIGVS